MTNPAPAVPADDRPYSPGLEGVVAGETALSFIDGAQGRLLYRGYPIGELVREGSYAAVAELLWTGDWNPAARLPCRPVLGRGPDGPARPPDERQADGRAADRGVRLGRDGAARLAADRRQARALTAASPTALAAFARIRRGEEPSRPTPTWTSCRATCSRSRRPARTTRRPGRWTPTSSSAPSTA